MKEILLFLIMIGLGVTKELIGQEELNIQIIKTYQYSITNSGEYFNAKKFNAQIDAKNYTWKDSIVNGQLIQRFFPNPRVGLVFKKEEYFYDDKKLLKLKVKEEVTSTGFVNLDSFYYSYIDDSTFEIIRLDNGKTMSKEIHQTINDTTYIETIIAGNSRELKREFLDRNGRKHSQRIKPVDVGEYIHEYNKFGDVVKVDYYYSNGRFGNNAYSVKYKYDDQNRIIDKETYRTNYEGEKTLDKKEIIIYE